MKYIFENRLIRALLMLLAVTMVLAFCSGCAVNGEWSKRDTMLEVAFATTAAMDAYTTANIQHTRDWHQAPGYAEGIMQRQEESTPFTRSVLGPRPKSSDTYQYFATVALSHWLIARALPPKWRPWFQGGTIAIHGRAVINNCKHGLCE